MALKTALDVAYLERAVLEGKLIIATCKGPLKELTIGYAKETIAAFRSLETALQDQEVFY